MNIDEPVQNDLLLKLMESSKGILLTADVISEMLKAHFLCPVYGEEKQLCSLSDGKNKYLMAFTDWDEYYKWNNTYKRPKGLIMTYYDYLRVMDTMDLKGFVINPYGCNWVIDNERIEYINKQSNIIKKGSSVAIGKPKEKPVQLINELINFFKKCDSIKRGYLLWMVRNNEASYLLVLDTDESPELLFPKISKVSRPFLSGKMLDMISIDSSFGRAAVEGEVPFYNK